MKYGFLATGVVLLGGLVARAQNAVPVTALPPGKRAVERLAVAIGPQAKLVEPFGIEFDRPGNAYIVELSGGRVLKVDGQGNVSIIAGALKEKGDAGDGGPAGKARFNGMHNLAVAPSGDIYLADAWNRKVRKIDGKSGRISTIAGTGAAGYSGDGGPAARATFGGVYCVSLNPTGSKLYLADLDNLRVRAVDLATGIVSLVAGNGQKGIPADGANAKTSPLVDPRAVAVDGKGNVYIVERGGHALRVVEPAGTIRTAVGASGKAGASGDGGDGKLATLNGPKHLCIDREGNVIIADTENHSIRKYIVSTGKIVRVSGTGRPGAAGVGGPPELAELARPHGVTVHADGTLYIADSENHRILRIEKVEPAAKRWEADLRRFAEEDRKSPPPKAPILFVGSSSIRLWDLKKSFPGRPVLNRGFGGSEASDSLELVDTIVLPYRPSTVVIYVGDNDIARDKTPQQVAADVDALVKKIRAGLSNARIIVLSIKPSVARWKMVDSMRQANAAIEKFMQGQPRMQFIDVHSVLLGADGKPRAELLQSDGLHLNDEGYKLWTAIVQKVLDGEKASN